MISMSDLKSDLRLVIGTGKVAIGAKESLAAVSNADALAVVMAVRGNADVIGDLRHACSIAGIKTIRFEGNSFELGEACGKPYSVNAIAVLNAGNSEILKNEYA